MKTLFCAVFTAMLFVSCTVYSQSKLPATWQPGMTLHMSYGGGMRYYSFKLQISDTGSFFMENVEGRVTNFKLDLTKKDLDSLLAFMRKHRFDKIEERMTGPIHDKGTENLSISWNGQYIGVGEGYMQLIADKDWEDYGAIEGYITTLRETKKRKVKSIPGQEPPQ